MGNESIDSFSLLIYNKEGTDHIVMVTEYLISFFFFIFNFNMLIKIASIETISKE